MGRTYDAKLKLEKIIQERRLNEAEMKGKLSLKAGMLLAFVKPDSPDDPVKLERLRAAARELLQVEI
jgi:hypothetical protein